MRGESAMKKLQIVRWEDPPPTKTNIKGVRGGSRESMWDGVAETLRDNPGQWALVRQGVTKAAAMASNVMIYAGGAHCFRPRATFESSVRVNEDGTWNVFARYVGGECS